MHRKKHNEKQIEREAIVSFAFCFSNLWDPTHKYLILILNDTIDYFTEQRMECVMPHESRRNCRKLAARYSVRSSSHPSTTATATAITHSNNGYNIIRILESSFSPFSIRHTMHSGTDACAAPNGTDTTICIGGPG